MKRILMIAYHFPPLAGSSGIQRTLRFVQHLPELGWQPIVLSANERAYERTSPDLLAEVGAGTTVRRAFALDAARHLSIKGRFLGWTARPDRWVSWRLDGVRQGMNLIREFAPDVIWSTHPVPTAHMIGAELHRRTAIPWVADFRDPMVEEEYPADPRIRRSYQRIEEDALTHARFALFTSPGAAEMYRERYPSAASRIVVLENGYDEESFDSIPTVDRPRSSVGHVVLLHSGIVYPAERDPTQLFVALRRLRDRGDLTPANLRFVFRAPVHDTLINELARRHGVGDFVETRAALPYREALAEMMAADALLVMQAASCNRQIPAKLYEYLRARRPVIGLTDPAGDCAFALRAAGLASIAALESAVAIEELLPSFVADVKSGRAALPDTGAIARASRRERSRNLARLLDQAVA
jgi:glycosyltransferase involved in cell wall biosynthesis